MPKEAPTRNTQRAAILTTLEREIAEGKYPPEQAMPSEHEMCRRFQVSRGTVRLVLADLEHKGHIYKRHGKGTFAHPAQQHSLRPIGLLIREPQKLSNPYFMDLIRGANSYLSSVGSYVSVIHQSAEEWSAQLINSLDGVIVVPTPLKPEEIAALNRSKLPYIICTDARMRGPTISYGVREAAQELTMGLLKLGHRKFGIISGHMKHSDLLKKQGIAKALDSKGIAFDTVPDYLTNFDATCGREAARELLTKHPDVTAIIASDDVLAIVAIQVAQQLGRRVPEDLSVVGFNDLPLSALFDPALTTVNFPVLDAGRRAAELLCLHALKKEPLASQDLGYRINWRQSTAAPRSGKNPRARRAAS